MKGAFVYDTKSKNFHFYDVEPDRFSTSHEKILARLKYKPEDCIGGSIKEDGSIHFRSRSINEENHGLADMQYSPAAKEIREKLDSGCIVHNMNYVIKKIR